MKLTTNGMLVKTTLSAGSSSLLTVYGDTSCPWTKKQISYLEGKDIPFNFVDCIKQGCPSYVHAFPTLDNNGNISTGYKEI